MLFRRRTMLALAGAAWTAALRSASAQAPAGAAVPSPEPFDVKDVLVGGIGRRFTLCVPRHLATDERVPLLVLLHGLGETGDERMGAYAWLERYGLATAYDRLRRAPLQKTSKRADWSDKRLAEVNALLAKQPFRGMAIACAYTPNINKMPNPKAALDDYARWIADDLVPRARSIAPVLTDTRHTTLDGCSLGGYIGLEVFLRQPESFGAWGGVQCAFGAHRAEDYAERIVSTLARVGQRDLHLETSSGDPFLKGHTALSAALDRRKVAHETVVLPGPHDQPWLREAGTIEMLLWHDRRPR